MEDTKIVGSIFHDKWRVAARREAGIGWRVLLVEHIHEQYYAHMIQRFFRHPTSNPAEIANWLARWKTAFADYAEERSRQANWPLPQMKDRFTVGHELCIVEELPTPLWTPLSDASPPSDPSSWCLAFLEGLELIHGHGNPQDGTILWRDSNVLFARSTFPYLDSAVATLDTDDWLRKIVQLAFQCDLSGVLQIQSLHPKLRDWLESLYERIRLSGANNQLTTESYATKPDLNTDQRQSNEGTQHNKPLGESTPVSTFEPVQANVDPTRGPNLKEPNSQNRERAPIWWVAPGMIAFLLGTVLAFSVWQPVATPQPPRSSILRIGVYNWPSFAVHFALQVSSKDLKLESAIVDDLKSLIPSQTNDPQFDVVVVPLCSLVERYSEVASQGWKIAWLPDGSGILDNGKYTRGMDRVLVRNTVLSPASLFSNGKDWLSIQNTSAAHLLDSYLFTERSREANDYLSILKPKHFKDKPITPAELLDMIQRDNEQVGATHSSNPQFVAVAVHEPWATAIKRLGFQDITENTTQFPFLNHDPSPHVNVLLVRDSVADDDHKREAFIALILSLSHVPSDNSKIVNKDPAIANEFGFDHNLDNVVDTLQSYHALTVIENIRFGYSIGPNGCMDEIRHYEDSFDKKEEGPERRFCSQLVNTHLIEQILKALQDHDANNVPSLSDTELQSLCESESVLANSTMTDHDRIQAVYGFVSSKDWIFKSSQGYEPITDQLNRLWPTLKDRSSSFCLIGHADEQAFAGHSKQEVENMRLGENRAKSVRQVLTHEPFNLDSRQFTVVSMGRMVLLPSEPGASARNRRVELWQIPFKFTRSQR